MSFLTASAHSNVYIYIFFCLVVLFDRKKSSPVPPSLGAATALYPRLHLLIVEIVTSDVILGSHVKKRASCEESSLREVSKTSDLATGHLRQTLCKCRS